MNVWAGAMWLACPVWQLAGAEDKVFARLRVHSKGFNLAAFRQFSINSDTWWWAQITSLYGPKDGCTLSSVFFPGWRNRWETKRFVLFFGEPPWSLLNVNLMEYSRKTATFRRKKKCWLFKNVGYTGFRWILAEDYTPGLVCEVCLWLTVIETEWMDNGWFNPTD